MPPRFSPLQSVIIEPPRHAATDVPVSRGQIVTVRSVLEPVDGEAQYRYRVLVETANGVRSELVAPEGWLRARGTLATSTECASVSIGALLRDARENGGFYIPLFQRRYCWSESQWSGLWDTVQTLAMHGNGSTHSLKRLLFLRQPSGSLVIDGQQRLTTCCVLLAALREHCSEPLQLELGTLLQYRGQFIVRPTLEDRAPFAVAMQHSSSEADTSAEALAQCRTFFSERVRAIALGDVANVDALVHATTHSLLVLSFPVAGSVQLQAIYEKAAEAGAMRAAAKLMEARLKMQDDMEEAGGDFEALSDEEILNRFKKHEADGKSQIRGIVEEGIAMSPVDLIRSYVLEHFETEEEQIRVYHEQWLPIERACCHGVGSNVAQCELGFASALKQLGADPAAKKTAVCDRTKVVGASPNSSLTTKLKSACGMRTQRNSGKTMTWGLAQAPMDVQAFVEGCVREVRRKLAIYSMFQEWWQGREAKPFYEARIAAFKEAVLVGQGLQA